MNYRLHRINNYRFSVRLCTVAKTHGYKTIGKFYDFLKKHDKVTITPYMWGSTMKSSKLIKEIEDYISKIQ